MSKRRGYTLIELVAVISLIVVISSSVLIFRHSESSKALSKIEGLYSDILYIRELSMNNKKGVYVKISDDEKTYFVKEDRNLLSREVELYPAIIENCKSVNKTFDFFSDGTAKSAGTIYMKANIHGKEKKYSISVYVTTGNVELKAMD